MTALAEDSPRFDDAAKQNLEVRGPYTAAADIFRGAMLVQSLDDSTVKPAEAMDGDDADGFVFCGMAAAAYAEGDTDVVTYENITVAIACDDTVDEGSGFRPVYLLDDNTITAEATEERATSAQCGILVGFDGGVNRSDVTSVARVLLRTGLAVGLETIEGEG